MRTFRIVIVACFLISCTIAVREINYGNDQCTYCNMTIIDKKHSAIMTNHKGKQFNFDAVECLVNKVNATNHSKIGDLYVADFYNPGNLNNALESKFIISKSVKSPMGAYLSAVSNDSAANAFVEQFGGIVYNWDEIKEELSE